MGLDEQEAPLENLLPPSTIPLKRKARSKTKIVSIMFESYRSVCLTTSLGQGEAAHAGDKAGAARKGAEEEAEKKDGEV